MELQSDWKARPDGSVLVKICGILRKVDALWAIQHGADALGFNFFPKSKRALNPEDALPWIQNLPALAKKVAVVVNPAPSLLEKLLSANCFDLIQFHGDETPQDCARCPSPWMKALPGTPDALAKFTNYSTPYLLLDAVCAKGEYGGGGVVADWNLAKDAVQQHPEKFIFLAGGLSPENVATAIEQVRPFGVDVASGVEVSPGIKDPDKVRKFLEQVRTMTSRNLQA